MATSLRGLGNLVHGSVSYQLETPCVVMVMGMHRSGTSCITRVLNLMGASLGPVGADVMAPGSDEFHFESPELNWINEEILRQSGGSWFAPPTLITATAQDRWRCRQFLWRFARTGTATWKDPRMMLTYSVWRPLLPLHRMVACIRHPIDVARSLSRRDGMTLEEGMRLWTTYNERFLAQIPSDEPVHWVDFDEGIPAIERLVRELDGTWGLHANIEASQHYDRRTHHHREGGTLPAPVAELYDALKARAARAVMSSS